MSQSERKTSVTREKTGVAHTGFFLKSFLYFSFSLFLYLFDISGIVGLNVSIFCAYNHECYLYVRRQNR